MNDPHRRNRRGLALILVLLQFTLAASLVLGTRLGIPGLIDGGLTALGASVAIWAWVTMGWTRLRVMPDPRHDAVLLDWGPYRWVRHPMYSGLLLFILGLIVHDARPWRWLVFGLLAGVLIAKATIEERILCGTLPGYPAYRRRTGFFLPRIRTAPQSDE